MERRIVLAGLAAVFAAPALAQQSSGSSAPMSSGTAAGQTGAMRTGPMGQMGQAEMQHMQQTMQLGQMALETSRLAQQKAKNENLKQFAQFEVEEQTTLAQILQSMMEPQTTSGTGQSAQQGATPANMQMDAKGREMVQKLQQASGDAFDKEYLTGQIQGHRDLLQVQERYLQANSQNREHMAVARLARGRIQEHIALLEDMQKTMR
jgi:putative membrane protein